MAEPTREQFGDGQDNLAHAASKVAEATRLLQQQSAAKGTEMAANSANASVQASLETGSAAVNIAAGTAASFWGAAISAAWATRHTLYKILICICLFFTIITVLVVALPSIVTESVFGLNGTPPDPNATLESSYTQMAAAVSAAVESGYNQSLQKVEQIIADGGYDYNLSMDALINHAQSSAGYDVAYILAAYSASLQQKDTNIDDMVQNLQAVADLMFPVTSVEKEQENLIPVSYSTYKPQTVTVVTAIQPAGVVNGIPKYNYTTEQRTYYVPVEAKASDVEITIDAYRAIAVTVPIYSGGKITGVEQKTFFKENGTQTIQPSIEIVKYVECTIHPFDNSIIADAFDIDMSAEYPTFNITYGEAIQNMTNALRMTLYGSLGNSSTIPLTDSELIGIVNQQTCNDTRKHILTTALSLVGKVPYFWGGKSEAGWNEDWNTPKLVTSAGSSSTGTIRPFGLDCSGFTDWVYKTALGISIQAGSWGQYTSSSPISEAELLPGDLGFLMNAQGTTSHVLIFAGYTQSGARQWVHSESGTGVHISTPRYDAELVLRRPNHVNFNQNVELDAFTEPLYALTVDVTHYCACTKCCGPNAQGITASGKQVAEGMVAMSSHYPFGTQIMINGIMYTVEDRGGSGIENDISRVDIYVADHNYALRLGRFKTTAYIHRLGR